MQRVFSMLIFYLRSDQKKRRQVVQGGNIWRVGRRSFRDVDEALMGCTNIPLQFSACHNDHRESMYLIPIFLCVFISWEVSAVPFQSMVCGLRMVRVCNNTLYAVLLLCCMMLYG